MVIELTAEEQAHLTRLANELHLSEADVVSAALGRLAVSRSEEYRQAVREADEDFANGNIMSHEDVVRSFADVLKHL